MLAKTYLLSSGCYGFSSSDSIDPMEEWNETNGIRTQRGYNSSSNSNCSSISSISSSSSETDYKMATGAGELEADADSLSSRQSGLSFNDRSENDSFKLVLHLIFNIHLFPML